MRDQDRRRLVIDANVARSAGETEHAVSSACRKFLDAVTVCEHRVVMTAEIQQEWRKHASRYARRWLTRMYGRRLVYRTPVASDDRLRRRVALVLPSLDDLHLMEAAQATDKLVASQDERARSKLRAVAVSVRVLRSIVWVNPTRAAETPVDWLSNGAVVEESRKLGVLAS